MEVPPIRPLIGITTYYVKDEEMGKGRVRGIPGQDMLMSTMDYARCIERAGGIPVALPVIIDEEYISELAVRLNGFLFTGGSDIGPAYNKPSAGSVYKTVPERDDFEFILLREILKIDKPVLGICRGFQLINLFFGGTLHQDIGNAGITDITHAGKNVPKYDFRHYVSLERGGKIFQFINKSKIFVNSFHHQAVKKTGDGLIETGWAEDGLVEAIEHKQHSFVVGVQWHPEMMAEKHNEQLLIFNMFLDAIHK